MEEEAPPPVHVLLIEDSQADALLLKRNLERRGGGNYRITVARTRSAAAMALRKPFDVCLMDFYLGGFTGLDLLRSLEQEDLPGPVILITGTPDEGIDESALDSGVADCLSKSEAATPLLDRTIRYARRQYENQQRLRHMAQHDALTGLLNRQTFMQRLGKLLTSSAQAAQRIQVLCIGLDGFKTVNDNWGHDVGDRSLMHAAERLSKVLGDEALLGRFGGDAMVAAVGGHSDAAVEELAGRLLAALRIPLFEDHKPIVTTASIGIASARLSPDDAQELVRLADHAMFAAKRAGRDTYVRHLPGMPISARLRADLEADLRKAVEDDQLWLAYEPQISLWDGRLLGAEALSRWTHPEHGRVPPSKFVGLALACGLIRPLTRWCLRQALDSLAQWRDRLPEDFRLSVNIAPSVLLGEGFAGQLEDLLTHYEVPARHLRLEITESFFANDGAHEKLQDLHRMGLSLALDDFGTGYSSLARLARMPIDTLKIDLSFVHDMVRDRRAAALVKSILSIGSDLDMTVIAEGVESPEQAEMLREYGCGIAQGFLYAIDEDRHAFSRRLG